MLSLAVTAMTKRLRRGLAIGAGLAVLAGCAAEAPAPVVVAAPVPPRPVVVAPVPRVLDAVWRFEAGDAACVAVARSPGTALTVTVRQDGVGFALQPLGRRVASVTTRLRDRSVVNLSFTGNAGQWRAASSRGAGGSLLVNQSLDEEAAGRILPLLEGGMIEREGPDAGLQPLRLPPSGAAGRAWFECVRRMLLF